MPDDFYYSSHTGAQIDAILDGAVRSDTTQSLSSTAQERARNNIGAYAQQANGIPKSDLASAVQVSLNKADSALQSAPVTAVDGKTGSVVILPTGGTTGQVLKKVSGTNYDVAWGDQSGGGGGGGTSDYTDLSNKPQINGVTLSGNKTSYDLKVQNVNPNLLDNWYFVGGNTNNTYGKFPVNQRGYGSYSTAGAYTIDRWRTNTNESPSVTVSDDGVTFATTNNSGAWCAIQEMEVSPLLGKTVTLSAKVESISASGRGYISLYMNPNISGMSADITSSGLYSMTVTIPSNTTRIRVIIGAPTSMKLSAIKLELGDTQTLAHQEGSTWVLNEIPNYGEQLEKCQAYLYRFSGTTPAYGWLTQNGTQYKMVVPLPVNPAKSAISSSAISMTGWIGRSASGYVPETPSYSFRAPTSLSADIRGNQIIITDTLSTSSTLTNNVPVFYEISNLSISFEP